MKNSKLLLGIALATATIMGCSRDNNPENWTDDEVSEWFNRQEWLGSATLQPDSSINERKLAVNYHRHPERWDTAFAFLSKTDLSTLADGKYELDGDNAFAMISQYEGRLPDTSNFEAHGKYADIQMVISGAEHIRRADTAGATIVQPYSKEKDIMFLQPADYREYTATPGRFFIFFPGEAHMPGVRANDSLVRKVVVKIRVDQE